MSCARAKFCVWCERQIFRRQSLKWLAEQPDYPLKRPGISSYHVFCALYFGLVDWLLPYPYLYVVVRGVVANATAKYTFSVTPFSWARLPSAPW